MPVVHGISVEHPDRIVRVGIRYHFNEAEPAGSARVPLGHHLGRLHLSSLTEQAAQVIVRDRIREVPDV